MKSRRLLGIQEHLERAQLLFDLATKSEDYKANYRLLLAAIYSCRAVTELMFEAAAMQEVWGSANLTSKLTRDELELRISPELPFYTLIERIRIHDFHRFGLVPPNPMKRELMFGGRISLCAQNGSAEIALTNEGPQELVTGSSEIKSQRPLLVRNGEFYDAESAKYVSLSEVVRQFLTKAPSVVSVFASNVA